MKAGPWTGIWVVVIALALLIWGSSRLLQTRFSAGDVYPAYSSLRADPVGLKALHDALSDVPGKRVSRFTSSYLKFPKGKGAAVLFAGVNPMDLRVDVEEFRVLDRFLREGGRLVVAYSSQDYEHRNQGLMGPAAIPTKLNSHERDLRKEWDCMDKVVALDKGALASKADDHVETKFVPAVVQRAEGWGADDAVLIPSSMEWHSPGVFENLGSEWKPVLVRGTNGVVMAERSVGLGTLVVATDSYWLSNEAMKRGRQIGLVTWGLGEAVHIFFDETHLGTAESMGVMTMIRNYRLHLFAGILMILGALGVWRASVSFVPREENSAILEESTVVAAMDAGSGLSNLLRRSVSGVELLPVCLHEWLKSGRGGRTIPPEKLAAAEAVVQRENRVIESGGKTHPVRVYQEITGLLRPLSRGVTHSKNKTAEG